MANKITSSVFDLLASKRLTLKELHKQRMAQYVELIKELPLDASKKRQLNVDFINYIFVLHNLARKHMWLNDVTNILVIVLSAIVPLMINVQIAPEKPGGQATNFIMLATVLSVILAILNAFRQAYKYREKWQSHLETAEQLILEGQSYFSLSGNYASFATHDLAFKKFIETVNLMRAKQLNKFINQLSSVNDKEIIQGIEAEISARVETINAAKDKADLRKLINDELNVYAKANPDVSYFEIEHERMLVTFFVSDPAFVVPDKFEFKHKQLAGVVYKVEKAAGEAAIQSDIMVGTGIKNNDMPSQEFGSVGCILKRTDNTDVLVTCYHVVKHANHKWSMFQPGAHDKIIDTDGEVIGKIVAGEKSAELDSALVKLDKDVNFDDLLPGQKTVKEPVFIDENNIRQFSDVFIISRKRNFKKIQGKLAEIDKHVTLNYGSPLSPDKKDLEKIMIIHFVSTEPFSIPGDSGSLVFAGDGTAIGMIVGGDMTRASFAIPFTAINDRYNLKFF